MQKCVCVFEWQRKRNQSRKIEKHIGWARIRAHFLLQNRTHSDNIANSFIQMLFGARFYCHKIIASYSRCFSLFLNSVRSLCRVHCFAARNLHNEQFRFDYIICSNNHLIEMPRSEADAGTVCLTFSLDSSSSSLSNFFMHCLIIFQCENFPSKGLFLHVRFVRPATNCRWLINRREKHLQLWVSIKLQIDCLRPALDHSFERGRKSNGTHFVDPFRMANRTLRQDSCLIDLIGPLEKVSSSTKCLLHKM